MLDALGAEGLQATTTPQRSATRPQRNNTVHLDLFTKAQLCVVTFGFARQRLGFLHLDCTTLRLFYITGTRDQELVTDGEQRRCTAACFRQH
jgi:hypothetical protein